MKHPASDLLESLTAYERWVDARIPTVAADRADKHARMAADPFAFLRAGYARWAQRVPALAGDAPGPRLLAVGDLHIENFGTWRDAEARVVWGVNDLDEADRLPAAHDLLRLATSAALAAQQGAVRLSPGDVVTDVLDGYARGVTAGCPIVLDRPDPLPLEPLLPEGHAERWWKRLAALPAAPELPPTARDLLAAAFPAGSGRITYYARVAGMGSRDHLRAVGVADLAGAPVVREIKAQSPPATWWLAPPAAGRDGAPPPHPAVELAARARRSPDPTLLVTGPWVVRRLAPWSDRIELTDLHHRADTALLLRAMGAETANLHLGSIPPADLAPLTTPAARNWLRQATERMLADTLADWQTFHDAKESAR